MCSECKKKNVSSKKKKKSNKPGFLKKTWVLLVYLALIKKCEQFILFSSYRCLFHSVWVI